MTILGLKVSDDSIAWSILENQDSFFDLTHKGIEVFPKGVKVDQKGETSRAAERTLWRATKIATYRRKIRKIQVLKVLSKHGYCPPLTEKELNDWKYNKIHPKNEQFVEWLKNDNGETKDDRQKRITNPYFFRFIAATSKLNLKDEVHRYMIGRAFYHLTQRRGYMSNRLDGKESDGAVMQNITSLNEEKGMLTLGQYFYGLYTKNKRIRGNYTDRITHYVEEFNIICELQNLPKDFASEIEKEIFFQRPLKIKKHHIGKCPYEPKKYRCAISHPVYEEFRMWSYINNIKMKTPDEDDLRPLTKEEKDQIIPLFFRKSRPLFDFEDICKKLAPKKMYRNKKDTDIEAKHWIFNMQLKDSVAGCPVSSQFESIFGEKWRDLNIKFTNSNGKECSYSIDDIWHVLTTFDNDENLTEFAHVNLCLNNDQVETLLKFKLPSGHANLSKNAMAKINYYLKQGFLYSHAVLMANMAAVVPEKLWNNESQQLISDEVLKIIDEHEIDNKYATIINGLIGYNQKHNYTWSGDAEELYRESLTKALKEKFGDSVFHDLFTSGKKLHMFDYLFNMYKKAMQKNYGTGEFIKTEKLINLIKSFILIRFGRDSKLNKLYHPNASEFHNVYGEKNKLGFKCESSKKIPVKNPIFTRVSSKLENLLNKLLDQGLIDDRTIIKLNCCETLRNLNERKAIFSLRRDEKAKKAEIHKVIIKYLSKEGEDLDVTEDDYTRYMLWEEQEKKCIYTDEKIELCDFLGKEKTFDLNYIIPLSQSFDISKANLTLASVKYTTKIKKGQIPGKLKIHEDIKERLKDQNKYIYVLQKQIENLTKQSKVITSADQRSNVISKRHKLNIERNYLLKKYNRLIREEIKDTHRFAITYTDNMNASFLQKYLKATFKKVYLVSDEVVNLFNTEWDKESIFAHKRGTSYFTNFIDAIISGCTHRALFDDLTNYYGAKENGLKLSFKKPWSSFILDLMQVQDEIVINHHRSADLLKKTKRLVRKGNKVVRDNEGKLVYQNCDTVRGLLHKQKKYGAIEILEEGKKGEIKKVIKHVIRKGVFDLTESEVEQIVDPVIKEVVRSGKEIEPTLRDKIAKHDVSIKELMREKRKIERENKDKDEDITEEVDAILKQVKDLEKLVKKDTGDIDELYVLKNGEQKHYIKRVRIFMTTVKNPMILKYHQNKSKHDYKRPVYVTNESNYCIGIYNGLGKKNKPVSDFLMLRNLDAAKRMNSMKLEFAVDVNLREYLLPQKKDKKGIELQLTSTLKSGSTVLFYENSPDEIWLLTKKEIHQRSYQVVGISEQLIQSKYLYGVLTFKHIDEPRSLTEVVATSGPWSSEKGFASVRKMNHGQFKALVKGDDYTFDKDGNIIKID